MTKNCIFLILFLSSTLALKAYSQVNKFISPTEELFNFKELLINPCVDNVKNVYAQVCTEYLSQLIKEDRYWVLNKIMAESLAPEQFEESPDLVIKTLEQNSAEAILTARVYKTENNLKLTLYLFTKSDGSLLFKEENLNMTGFSHMEFKAELWKLYQSIKEKLPFHGKILSRKNTEITLNMGINQGLKVGDELTAVQIFKVTRHPKYKFLISSDREILGRIKIYKIDDELSFASVLSEKDTGALQPGIKLLSPHFVQYPDKLALNKDKENTDPAFGEQPVAWVPEKEPTFGSIDMLLGISIYDLNTSVPTVDSFTSSSSMSPTVYLNGELWLNTKWFLNLEIKQNVLSASNPRSGSSPDNLNINLNQMFYGFGYNFLIADNFWGPKVSVTMGLSQIKNYVDNTTPIAYTTQSFGGITFGLDGSFPLEIKPLTLGASIKYFWNPSLTESPVESGSASATASSFGLYGIYHLKKTLKLKGDVGFDAFSSSFSGAGTRPEPATSSSIKLTSILFGIQYLF